MLKSLRQFIDQFAGGDEPPAFEETDHRLAAAALLVHAISVDGRIDDVERAKLRSVLKTHFDLDDAETEKLIAEAKIRDREAVDLYGFTSVLKRSLDDEGRRRVIAMMWQMVLADGKLTEFEDNVVWRVAELLGISTRDRVRLRKEVEQGESAGSA